MGNNHYGQPCIYEPILCQEGYCDECAIPQNLAKDIAMKLIEEVTDDKAGSGWDNGYRTYTIAKQEENSVPTLLEDRHD